MGKERTMLKFAVGGALLVTVTQGWALSLGATQGQVIIGRPLDILVQSSVDASEAAAGLCLEAEVLYGDVRVPASAVTTAIHRLGADGSGALRVQVSQAVSEPIVTVLLKAGCPPTFRRSYALLADVEPSAVAAAPLPGPVARPVTSGGSGGVVGGAPVPVRPLSSRPAALRPAGQAPATAAVAAPAASGAAVSDTPVRLAAPSPRPTGVAKLRSKARPPTVAQPVPVDAGRPPAPSPLQSPRPVEAAGPRLKLDPLDLSSAGPVAPAPSAEIPPVASAPAEAGVAPSTAPTEAATAPAVAKELEVLRAEQERLRLAMETMNAQLAQAEAGRYQNPVVYGLGAAVLALLGGVAVLWRRRRGAAATPDAGHSTVWWETGMPIDPGEAVPPTPATAPAVSTAWPHADDEVGGLEVREAGESLFREVPVAPLDAEALLDLWQRVDFFETLGQHTEAMAALQAFVSEHSRASEAPYLRWLAIARASGQAEALATAQAFYEHHFQRLVPSGPAAAGLDSDAALVQVLIQAWPDAAVRDRLLAALASQPGDPASPLSVRSLEAFDDLLSLLATWGLRDHSDEQPAPAVQPVSAQAPIPASGLAASEAAAPLAFPEWLSVADLPGASAGQPPAPAAAELTAPKDEPAPLDFDFFEWEPAPQPGDAPAPGKKPQG